MNAIQPLIDKRRFIGLDAVAHLCAGGEAPPLQSHAEAAARFLADKADAMDGRARFFDVRARAKRLLSGLLRLPPTDIAILLNASDGMATAVAGLDLAARDNIVVARSDYVSLSLSARRRVGTEGELRLAGSSITTSIASYEPLVDDRTRAVLVSHVCYLSGIYHDLAAFRALADRVGARLIVDVSHSLGAVPIDGTLCDALVSCCYKWQLGVHGCGVFAVNHVRWPDLDPAAWGWNTIEHDENWHDREGFRLKTDAERFETGNPPFLALYLLENGLSALMETDETTRASHIRALSGAVLDLLTEAGIDPVTPASPETRAGNVAYLCADPKSMVDRLRASGVLIWGGEGRVRISTHVYNDMADIEALRRALHPIAAQRPP